MLDPITKTNYRVLILSKGQEKDVCEKQLRRLKRLKQNITTEINQWDKSYKKHKTLGTTSKVIKKDNFEGNKAKKVKKMYHDEVKHMNSKYLPLISEVYNDLEKQITNIDAYITELESSISKMQTALDESEG